MSDTYVKAQFERLVKRCSRPTHTDLEWRKLRQFYDGPDRHYHDMRHIHSCLEWFECYKELAKDSDAIRAAILYHDVVYDPKLKNNELLSAEQFMQFAGMNGLPPSLAVHTFRMILATTHKSYDLYDDPDGKLMLDIDLISLSFPWEEFTRNSEDIRREYAHVPENVYRSNRIEVLYSFLTRPQIYYTKEIRNRHEKAARDNLVRGLGLLVQ